MPTILWDVDGTLVSTAGGLAGNLFAAAVGRVLGVDAVPALADGSGRTDLAVLRATFEVNGVGAPVPDLLAAAMAELDAASTVGLYRRERRVLPGVAAVLTELDAAGVTHAVVTGNSPARARAKLEAVGLLGAFDLTRSAFGDRALERKAVVRRGRDLAADRLPVLVVGDTPLDVTSAQALRLPVLAVATGDHRVDELARLRPDAALASLVGATATIVALLACHDDPMVPPPGTR